MFFKTRNGEEWSQGENLNESNLKRIIFQTGEYLTDVYHDGFENFKFPASGIKFVTNIGREFCFFPKVCSEKNLKHFSAPEGKEIVNLEIFRGIMRSVKTKRGKNIYQFPVSLFDCLGMGKKVSTCKKQF